jgi:U6 snRNA phosphodiesterase
MCSQTTTRQPGASWMKRTSAALVSYSSSEGEDNSADEDENTTSPPPVKKRKLPTLSSNLVVPVPVDDPTKHQGRIRSTPHVEGQWATHVYINIPLSRQSPFWSLLQNVVSDAKSRVPALHDFWSQDISGSQPELHVSLTRPIFLRSHQREDLKRALKLIASQLTS